MSDRPPKALRMLRDLLKERGVYAAYAKPDKFFRNSWRLDWTSDNGTYGHSAYASGNNYVTFNGTVPVAGAVLATLGPDRRLEDAYPFRRGYISFGGLGVSVPTDGEHLLLTTDQADKVADDHRRLYRKCQNQKEHLRKLLAKVLMQGREIDRMEDDALRMQVLACGYAEGE